MNTIEYTPTLFDAYIVSQQLGVPAYRTRQLAIAANCNIFDGAVHVVPTRRVTVTSMAGTQHSAWIAERA